MRKILLSILLVLCLCFQSSAMSPAFLQIVGGGGAEEAPSNYCSSCTPGDPIDVRCEDAEGANTIETGATDFTTAQCSDWVAVIDTDAYLYEAAHSGTLACTDKGSYAIQYYVIDVENNDSESAMIYKNITDTDNLYLNLYFNIVSHFMANTIQVGLATFCSDDACTIRKSFVSIYNDGGTLKLRMNHKNSSGTYTYNLGATAISTNTWYRLGFSWVRATTSSVTLNGSAEIEAGVEGVANDNIGAVAVGSTDLSTSVNNHAVTVQIDNIGIDDDTMPGACPE